MPAAPATRSAQEAGPGGGPRAPGAVPPRHDGAEGSEAPGAPLELFRDIVVVPTQRFRHRIARGGPIWPDFERQTTVRHCRGGRPVDAAPARPAAVTGRIEEPCVWGGLLDPHFGHFVADHWSRLPAARTARPEDPFLFIAPPELHPERLPSHLLDLLAWAGLRPDQVRIVTAPVAVAELRVGAQAEMLTQVPPGAAYLALLDRLARAHGLVPEPSRLLYVTRAGAVARGEGGHAGEGYLVDRLRALGAAIVDPAEMPLSRQLALYAGAERLVFAEGSALHGRQLLGHRPQEIDVLRRRAGRWTARAMLAPRCDRLRYHDVSAGSLMHHLPNGEELPARAVALYDLEALFDYFGRIGLNIAAGWDEGRYRAAVLADLEGWFARHQPRPEHLAEHAITLAWAGFPLPKSQMDRAGRAARAAPDAGSRKG